MDIRLLLVKSTMLAYQANLLVSLDKKNQAVLDDVNHFLTQLDPYVSIPESALDGGLERNSYKLAKDVLYWLSHDAVPTTATRKEILSRLRVVLTADERYYHAFEEALEDYPDEDSINKDMAVVRKDLQVFLSQESIRKFLREASYKSQFKAEEITDWNAWKETLVETLSTVSFDLKAAEDPAFVSSIDFSDLSQLKSNYAEMEKVFSKEGIIKTPFQGLNEMMGENNGIRRGEFVNVYGLAHNYKSGMLIDLFCGTVLFNDPYVLKEGMKPAIVVISLEDDMHIMLKKIFVIFKQRETGLAVRADTFTYDQMAEYVQTTVQARGWHVFFHRVIPSNFNISKYIGLLRHYKNEGYEVAVAINDYLAKMSLEGINQKGANGDAMVELHSRVFEYTKANEITHFTGHQLSPDAKREKRLSEEDFIHRLPGRGYTEGASKLDTIPDIEVFMNKRDTPHGTFMEFLWGKHRGDNTVLDNKRYFAMLFNEKPMYGLPYDVDGESLALTSVSRSAGNAQGGGEWFDLTAE